MRVMLLCRPFVVKPEGGTLRLTLVCRSASIRPNPKFGASHRVAIRHPRIRIGETQPSDFVQGERQRSGWEVRMREVREDVYEETSHAQRVMRGVNHSA